MYIYNIYVYPKNVQFAAFGQFVFIFFLGLKGKKVVKMLISVEDADPDPRKKIISRFNKNCLIDLLKSHFYRIIHL